MKRIFLWIIVIAIVGLALIGVGRMVNKPADGDLATAVNKVDQVKGAENAPVTIVEYSDFQCPACAAYAPFVNQLVIDRPNDVRVVFRHYPLAYHQYAEFAAIVAEAAGRQGLFWEMHDVLFANQSEWSKSSDAMPLILSYIQGLGLDLDQFQTDVADTKLRDKVRDDYRTGNKSRVAGTPTFFVNGRMISNPRNYAEFLTIIDQALATTTNATSTATSTATTTTNSAR